MVEEIQTFNGLYEPRKVKNPFKVGDEVIVPESSMYSMGDKFRSNDHERTGNLRVEVISVTQAENACIGTTRKGKDRIRVISSKISFLDENDVVRKVLVSPEMCFLNGKAIELLPEIS